MKMTSDDLRDSINYTAQRTGFPSAVIEKDYYCSLVLKILYENEQLKNIFVFKGGTLLSKRYLNFFRMSEDLDFSIINSFCINRNERKKIATIFKTLIPFILKELNFKEVSPFQGYNESSHYNGIFSYNSVIGPTETIKFDVGLRGDLVLEPIESNLKTLLMSPISYEEIFPNITALTLSKKETYAEKFRAALTRDPYAIRDFFDVQKIFESDFDVWSEDFISLVREKIQLDPAANIDLTLEKKKKLDLQILTDLKPVLRFNEVFLIDKSWGFLQNFVHNLQEKN